MRMVSGVYEGPGSHGVLRVAASMKGVHAVLRALPSEGYFSTMLGDIERTGTSAPVTINPVREQNEGPYAPGDLERALADAARRQPGTEILVLARSDAALLSGDPVPDTELPENPQTGRAPRLVACEWESPGMGEYEAADLALEELVRTQAGPRERSPSPTVNVFGPPIFGPGAAAEYDEAERLLALMGVGVNARVPLGTSATDLSRLPRAWANLLLYREIGESATLYLQDEIGMKRVTTPMIGSFGTGAALRAVGKLCHLDANRVQRAIWSELARSASLPWYVRLQKPETLQRRRAAIFGDYTYAAGLGHALAREVGLEVAWCGTYLRHMEREFLFHADAFTDDAFVTDDPEEVATRIERTNPDLLIGTHLEEEIAASLGIPFLQLCPPISAQPFDRRPIMGYIGSNALADALEDAVRRMAGRPEIPSPGMPWTEEALEELEEVPAFLRGRARRLAEERARDLRYAQVTREIFDESRL